MSMNFDNLADALQTVLNVEFVGHMHIISTDESGLQTNRLLNVNHSLMQYDGPNTLGDQTIVFVTLVPRPSTQLVANKESIVIEDLLRQLNTPAAAQSDMLQRVKTMVLQRTGIRHTPKLDQLATDCPPRCDPTGFQNGCVEILGPVVGEEAVLSLFLADPAASPTTEPIDTALTPPPPHSSVASTPTHLNATMLTHQQADALVHRVANQARETLGPSGAEKILALARRYPPETDLNGFETASRHLLQSAHLSTGEIANLFGQPTMTEVDVSAMSTIVTDRG